MSAPSVQLPSRAPSGVLLAALIGGTVLLTVVAVLLSGHPAAALAGPLAVGALWLLFQARLRTVALLLLFAVLVLDNPGDRPAQGHWTPPLAPLGTLLLTNLNKTIPIGALKFGLMDLLFVLLLGVVLYRKSRGIRLDQEGQVQTAPPMFSAAGIAVVGLCIAWAYGLATGGSFQSSLWQVQKLLYLPLTFFLFHAALKGPSDHGILARILIVAACFKSLVAVYVRLRVHAPSGEPLAYATTHTDSLLFALAATLVLAALFEDFSRKNLTLCLLVLPVVGAGMIANTRRLVWVEVAFAVGVMLLIMPRNPLKRLVLRTGVILLPFALLYLAVGWNSGAGIFKPAQMVRSVVDSDSDRSSATRDIENYNLVWTLRTNLLLGRGFGHEYIEMVKQDDISHAFPIYRYVPHNSVLGVWAYSGLVGFTSLWMFLMTGVFFALRAYHHATRPSDRTAALTAIGAVVIYLAHAWGDMGLNTWMGLFLVSAALAMACKLAVAVGAWPARRSAPVSDARTAPGPASTPALPGPLPPP